MLVFISEYLRECYNLNRLGNSIYFDILQSAAINIRSCYNRALSLLYTMSHNSLLIKFNQNVYIKVKLNLCKLETPLSVVKIIHFRVYVCTLQPNFGEDCLGLYTHIVCVGFLIEMDLHSYFIACLHFTRDQYYIFILLFKSLLPTYL